MHSRRSLGRFLALPENQAAFTAVQELADDLTAKRSVRVPALYLHGPAGAGKTQLINSLVARLSGRGSELILQRLDANELSLPAETRPPGKIFAPNQRAAVAGKGAAVDRPSDDWREPARGCDLLILEDLQQLGPYAVEILCALLDERASLGLPVVLTARVGPQHLTYRGSRFPARFTSRLTGGLVVQMQPLQTASRLALLTELAQQRRLTVNAAVLHWLAEHITGGGRQLNGALERIDMLWRTRSCSKDAAALIEHFQADGVHDKPDLQRIAERVSTYFQLDVEKLQSPSRLRNIMLPRQVSMYLARKLTALSLEQIGAYFGGRDHTTVLHACRKVEQALENDPRVSGLVREIHAALV